ncbi:MAG: glycosyltransferase family 2 protein [Bacteroidales bacterium]|nr:glycosyltransferase family 2 protein [Bacteroidales bacterium]
MMMLDLIIATHSAEGIERVARMVLPPREGVRYIVSWQNSGSTPIPPALQRADIDLLRTDTIGSSSNRNNALDHSSGDIRLIVDDDLIFTADQLESVRSTFEANPELDVALFRYDGPDAKQYPPVECKLPPVPKGYYITAFEMAIRNRGEAARLRYDERFGIHGTIFTIAEEEELLYRIIKARLDLRLFPITITTHPGLTTGNRPMDDPRALRARGVTISLFYPLTWPLRIPLVAWRESRKGRVRFFSMLSNGLSGAVWRFLRYH